MKTMDISQSKKQRTIFFEGDSIMNLSSAGVINGRYVTSTAYESIIAVKEKVAMSSYAQNDWQLIRDIIPVISTNISPYISETDLIVIGAGSNDIASSKSGQQLFDALLSYRSQVIGRGVDIVVCTLIARNYAGDKVDTMTEIANYNQLVIDNTSVYNYTVCDVAADSSFSDPNNSAFYSADNLNLTTDGMNLYANYLSNTLIELL